VSDPFQDELDSEFDPSQEYADDDFDDDYDELDGSVGAALGAGALGMGAGHQADQLDDFEFDDEELAPVALGLEDDYEEDDYEDDEDDDLGFLGAAFGSAAAARMPDEPVSAAPQFDSPEAAQLAELINEGPDHPYYSEAIIQRAKLFEKNGDLPSALSDYQNFIQFAKAGPDEKNQSRLRVITIRQQLEQFDEAEQAIKKMLAGAKLAPRFEAEAIFQWILLLIKRDKLIDALKVIAGLQRKFPRNTFADRGRYYAGVLLLKLKRQDRALREFQIAAASERIPQKMRAKAANMMVLLLGGESASPTPTQAAAPPTPARRPAAQQPPAQAPAAPSAPTAPTAPAKSTAAEQTPSKSQEATPPAPVTPTAVPTQEAAIGFTPAAAAPVDDGDSDIDDLQDEFERDLDGDDEIVPIPLGLPGAAAPATQTAVPVQTFQPAAVPMSAESVSSELPFSSRQAKLLLMVAAVISMLVHAGMALGLYNRPLATIDPDLLRHDEFLHKISRAEDMVVQEEPDAGEDGQKKADQIEDLTKDLLSQDPPPDSKNQNQEEIDPNKQLDFRPDSNIDGSVLGATAFNVDSVLSEGGAISLPSIGTGGTGTGTSSGSAIVAARVRASRNAASILGESAGVPHARTGAGALDRPDVAERLKGPRDDALFGGSDAAVVDFSGLGKLDELGEATHLDGDFEFTLTTYREPGIPGFFRVDVRPKHTLKKLKTLPKDVVFLIDTSGSIQQSWVKEIVAGVSGALNTLNEDTGDRFNIVFFSDKPRFLSEQRIQAANARTLSAAHSFLRSAKAKGFTDVNQALSRLLVRDIDRVYNLVLISDGVPTRGVMKTRELIDLITRGNEGVASIYSVGVGRKINREVLDFLSYRNKGSSVLVDGINSARAQIMAKMVELRYPLLMNLNMDIVGIERKDVFPSQLPNIHQGQTLSVYGRYASPGQFKIRLAGTNGKTRYDFSHTGTISEKFGGDRSIPTECARWKLHHMYGLLDRLTAIERAKMIAQIKTLAGKYNIKTLYDKD